MNMAYSQEESSVNQAENKAPGWLLLSLDGRRVALPKKDAKLISLASSMQRHNTGTAAVGKLEYEDHMWPAYNLDQELKLSTQVQETRRFCVVLAIQQQLIGLLCDEVLMLAHDEDLSLQAIPEFVQQSVSPVVWICKHEDQLMPVCEPGAMAQYIGQMEQQYVAD